MSLVAAISIAIASCSHDSAEIFGASDTHVDASAQDAGTDASALLTAPYLMHPKCEACLMESCADRLEDCEKDEECARSLACQAACQDPACVQECGLLASPNLDRVYFCAITFCPEPCAIGKRLACAGNYMPEPRFEIGQEIDHEVQAALTYENGSLDGIRVIACSFGNESCVSSTSETTIMNGVGRLRVTVTDPTGWKGTIRFVDERTEAEIEDSGLPRIMTTNQVSTLSRTEASPSVVYLGSLENYDGWLKRTDEHLDPERAYVTVLAGDCFLDFASELVLKVEPPDFRSMYYWNLQQPDVNQAATSLTGFGAISVNGLPPNALIDFILEERTTGRIIARTTATTRAGELTTILMRPLTREQARALAR